MLTPVEVLGNVRVRTQTHVSVRLGDSLALSVALSNGSLESDHLVEYAFAGQIRSDAIRARSELQLSGSEFASLFGARDDGRSAASCPSASKRVAVLDGSAEGQSFRKQLESALSCTLCEKVPLAMWQRFPGVRLAAIAALMRADDSQVALEAVLGSFVVIDARRVDDLKTSLEDGGIDLIFVSEVLGALSECATM